VHLTVNIVVTYQRLGGECIIAEVQLLQDKIRALEDALKLSNIKAEGFEVMMRILKDEYGIDLSKKVEAEQSKNSRKDTRK